MIADRYAEAIFGAAQETGAIDRIDSELFDITQMLEANGDLQTIWMHPVVETSDKQAMARELFTGKVHPFTLNLILLLFDKKRGTLFPQVQKAFRDRFNAARRRATVKVTSAMPLDAGLADQLRAQLSSQLEKEVQMETAIDPDLLGGMILQIEDRVIDNSLRGRLEALRHSMN